MQSLSPDLKLNIHSLTILFTDLRGSTDLYDQTGDVFAYNIIQEHFRVLTRVVRHHSGAIIKTMGDAIMATFSTPLDGVLAAIDMINEIRQLNERIKDQGHELGLKIGLHEGVVTEHVLVKKSGPGLGVQVSPSAHHGEFKYADHQWGGHVVVLPP